MVTFLVSAQTFFFPSCERFKRFQKIYTKELYWHHPGLFNLYLFLLSGVFLEPRVPEEGKVTEAPGADGFMDAVVKTWVPGLVSGAACSPTSAEFCQHLPVVSHHLET